MLGTRGLPNRYGGSETCIEEIGSRLAREGHRVRVFCRRRVTGDTSARYRDMDLIGTPAIPVQAIDTLSHSLASLLWLTLRRVSRTDTVLHFHGSGNGAVVPLAKALGFRSVVTVDGADWQRGKWGRAEQRLLRIAARMAARFADVLVADSVEAEKLYRQWQADPVYIPYGAPEVAPESVHEDSILDRLGLRGRHWVLFVGRFVPEKGIHTLAEAFARAKLDDIGLVLVGGERTDSDYAARVATVAPDDTVFVGKLFGDQLDPILRAARAYVQPSSVEGTSPMVLTAMGYGIPTIASDIAENRETVGDHGVYFKAGSAESLASVLETTLGSDIDLRKRGEGLRRRAREAYSWDAVTAQYTAAYYRALGLRS